MRAFVEVDAVTGMKCLDVGLELKKFWRERVEVQVCLFAQENLFGEEEDGDDGDISENKKIFERALEEKKEGIDVIGSAPYVESSPSLRKQNIRFIVNLAIQYNKILDFHLDYNLNPQEEPLIWYVLEYLKEVDWIGKGNRCVTFGHCTRLTLFSENEWERLKREVGELNVGFVGLPGSDLFMMGRPEHREGQQKESSGQEGSKKGEGEEERKEDEEELRPDNRPRGTLQLLNMYNRGFQCGVAVNNVGNAFTPQGNLDPMSLCSLGVGLYQASTDEDMNILYSFVSSAAKGAIGLESSKEERDGEEDISREGKDMVEDMSIVLKVGRKADIVLFGRSDREAGPFYRRRRTVGDVVCDAGPERVTIYGGRVIKLE